MTTFTFSDLFPCWEASVGVQGEGSKGGRYMCMEEKEAYRMLQKL